MANSLIHARILLDRAIALSRAFLKDSPVPSFTSFHDHKKFFLARRGSFTSHKEYGDYICDQTSWFDVRLKAVRDKFFVHASPRHMRFMGLPNSHQVDLVIMLPAGENPDKPLERMKTIRVNALALSYEIDGFLVWLSAYGVAHSAPNKALQGARNSKRSVAVARP